MDGSSEHPLTNKAATVEFLKLQNIITQKEIDLQRLITQANNTIDSVKTTTATLNRFGLTQLTQANNVTNANAYALSGIEKNASVGGTLANQISGVSDRVTTNANNITSVQNQFNSFKSDPYFFKTRTIFSDAYVMKSSDFPMAGIYWIDTLATSPAGNAPDENVGDWKILALNSNPDFQMLLMASPRCVQKIWYGRFWNKTFTGWYGFLSYRQPS